jgi:hypothetical protein
MWVYQNFVPNDRSRQVLVGPFGLLSHMILTYTYMVQVLTSGEDSKSGCAPQDAVALARHISQVKRDLLYINRETLTLPD